MSGCGSTSSMTGLAAPASAVRRTQSQGAGRAASATEAAGLGPELLPRPEPALHHRLISPLTYFRLGMCSRDTARAPLARGWVVTSSFSTAHALHPPHTQATP